MKLLKKSSVLIAIVVFALLVGFNQYPESKEVKPIKHEIVVPIETPMPISEVNRGSYDRHESLALPESTKGTFKAYMDYHCISNTSSLQYKLQEQAYTDDEGFRRIDNDYMVALGSAYGTEIGTRYHILLDTGKEFTAVLGDCKDDSDTDSSKMYMKENGNITEFIIDVSAFDKFALQMGDVSYAGFEGGISSIERIIE